MELYQGIIKPKKTTARIGRIYIGWLSYDSMLKHIHFAQDTDGTAKLVMGDWLALAPWRISKRLTELAEDTGRLFKGEKAREDVLIAFISALFSRIKLEIEMKKLDIRETTDELLEKRGEQSQHPSMKLERVLGASFVSLVHKDGTELPRVCLAEMREDGSIYWEEGSADAKHGQLTLARFFDGNDKLLHVFNVIPPIEGGKDVTPGLSIADLPFF